MTLKEAIKHYNLDKRVKWFVFCKTVTRDIKGYPYAALDENNNPIKVTDKEFTHAK